MGLQGTWYNELGSKLEITQLDDGTLTGEYETRVSEDGCTRGRYVVKGRTDVGSKGDTVGFAVTWRNADSDCESTTTWAGQYVVEGDEERLIAMWLLVSKTDAGDLWASTQIGKDVFKRGAVDASAGPAAATGGTPHP